MSGPAIRIAPSLLAADFARLAEQIALVEEAGADLLHLDVMDGHFVPNLSFGLPVVEAVRRVTRLPLDTHLMIAAPERYLSAFRDAGSDSLTLHLEVCPDPLPLIDAVHALGLACGLVINPATPADRLFPFLDRVEMVLVMSVEPGFGGQVFQPAAVAKIHDLRTELDRRGLGTAIQVDGGINPETARTCRQAGATVLVAGSAVFRSPDPGAALRALRG
ncbi:MAG: ribulose-phosphate 3-epimerase [Candidatus Latescibacterota bacterium]